MGDHGPSERLGQAMRRLRRDRNLSQEDLAHLAGLDRTFVSLLERSKRRATLETADAIAHALGLTLSQLIQELEPLPSKPWENKEG